jgi:hypothetical protein
MKKAINAATYVECSSKDASSLSEVFDEIIEILEADTTEGKSKGAKKESRKKKVILREDSKTHGTANNKCTVF